MRRNNLLATGMLLALLATSACGAPAPNATADPAGATAGAVAAGSASEVGASQLAAAEKAKAAAAKKAEEEAANKAKADAEAKAQADAAKKAEETAAAEKAKEAAKAQAAKPLAVTGGGTAALPSAPAPAPAKAPAPVQAASASERIVNTAYTTAYTWYDNTPAGSATISHPVLHQTAGGTGTYEDPITIAVGHSLATGQDVLDVPAGTRIYLPNVRRYFIVEDTCGDGNDPENGPCHQGTNVDGTNSTIWIDMWIGGQSTSADGASSCAGKVTGVQTAVFDPASNYVVAPGAGVIHDGKCDAGYGNELVKR